MLNLEEIKNKLDNTGLPVAYRFFPEGKAPTLPFITYYTSGADNFAADGISYYKIDSLNVELYTKTKDTESEAKLEEALSFTVWSKEEVYIDSEKCYMITYTMEV